ncbi:MAG: DUF2089 domain-containing protein [Labilithrix sp.]|nr:DUF2089 domain-containing protein [Labilithrix sp.]MCW5810765.1 DUF2089 domain-containing protein [Labilithrix sp.]
MPRLVVRCPSCEGDLLATRLTCRSCGTALEGKFEIPALLQLAADDLAFVTAFVRASGSLKAIAQQLGVSYPTVRNRLDDILAKLERLEKGVDAKRHAILDALENGKLTAEAAAEELKKVGL